MLNALLCSLKLCIELNVINTKKIWILPRLAELMLYRLSSSWPGTSLKLYRRVRMADAVSVLPFSGEFQVISPVGRGKSWMGDYLGITSCSFSKKLGTNNVSTVVVVGLSRASRVFLLILGLSSVR